MLKRNEKNIAAICRGDRAVASAYRGDALVYSKGGGALDFLNFTSVEDGSSVVYSKSSVSTAEYSYDKINWADADGVVVALNAGQKVYYRGVISGNPSATDYAKFTITGKISADGSIMSLQNGNPNDDTILYTGAFRRIFISCAGLINAPALPATTLTSACYNDMFRGCASLINAPALPATTLTSACYYGMFQDCVGLVSAPALPANTLAYNCYNSIFQGCTSLNYIEALFITTPSTTYTGSWVTNVSPTGTFVKSKYATWDVTGDDGVPVGWTIIYE